MTDASSLARAVSAAAFWSPINDAKSGNAGKPRNEPYI